MNKGNLVIRQEHLILIGKLKEKDQARVFMALSAFSRGETFKKKLSKQAQLVFSYITEVESTRHEERSQKLSEYGKLGGRPKKEAERVSTVVDETSNEDENAIFSYSEDGETEKAKAFKVSEGQKNKKAEAFLEAKMEENEKAEAFSEQNNSTDSRIEQNSLNFQQKPEQDDEFNKYIILNNNNTNKLNNDNNKLVSPSQLNQELNIINITTRTGARVSLFDNYNNINNVERVPVKTDLERQPYVNLWSDFVLYHKNEQYIDVFYEIVDTLIEACNQTKTEKGLIFNQKQYFYEDFKKICSNITANKIRELVSGIIHSGKRIEHTPVYILGAILIMSDDCSKQSSKERLLMSPQERHIESRRIALFSDELDYCVMSEQVLTN